LIGSFEVGETPNGINFIIGRQTWSAKVLSRKGNSPDHKLKALNKNLVLKDKYKSKKFGQVGLEAAIF